VPKGLVCLGKTDEFHKFVRGPFYCVLEKLISTASLVKSMEEDSDLGEFVKEFKKVIADSLEILYDLDCDFVQSKEDELTPITNLQEVRETADDITHFAKIKKAESELVRRKFQ
jgi:methionine synthase II (cobalamin-independent)